MIATDPSRNPALGANHEPPCVQAAAARLGQEILAQVEEGEPVFKFPGDLVEKVAREAEGPVCLLGTHLRDGLPYQVIDRNLFLGVTSDANLLESARNHDPLSNAHFHWAASETLIVLKGRVRLYAWRGKRLFVCEAGVKDILHVPPGVPHKLEIDSGGGPALIYVARAPAAVKDYKQEWPPKTKP
jgi:mannose-6-phosphate isomerase-like protein (cupin superfamily)